MTVGEPNGHDSVEPARESCLNMWRQHAISWGGGTSAQPDCERSPSAQVRVPRRAAITDALICAEYAEAPRVTPELYAVREAEDRGRGEELWDAASGSSKESRAVRGQRDKLCKLSMHMAEMPMAI